MRRMRSPWSVRVLPAARSVAEGSWLAVLYAALQAAGGDIAHLGPIELGVLVLAGNAWGHRRRWTSPTGTALGLLLLALLAGLGGWLLDAHVRAALLGGNLIGALSLHTPGWLAALAFWRGAARRAEDDAVIEDRLMRWALPGLAIPWLIGYAAASGPVEDDFAAAAFLGTLFFVGSAFSALGLARLEALRVSTGSDWRGDRSWLFMVLGLAVALTAVSVPVAALLRIPAHSLLGGMVVPLQTFILVLVVVTAPIFILAAIIVDLLKPVLPEGLRFHWALPSLTGRAEPGSDLPAIILTAAVAAIFLFELLVLGAMVWIAVRERRRRQDLADAAFEERAIVVHPPEPGAARRRVAARSRGVATADDATGAYLSALDALAVDGRWPRREHETPAAHLVRARAEGLRSQSFGRLATAYQLARYGPRPISSRETRRARARFEALRLWLSRSHDS